LPISSKGCYFIASNFGSFTELSAVTIAIDSIGHSYVTHTMSVSSVVNTFACSTINKFTDSLDSFAG